MSEFSKEHTGVEAQVKRFLQEFSPGSGPREWLGTAVLTGAVGAGFLSESIRA